MFAHQALFHILGFHALSMAFSSFFMLVESMFFAIFLTFPRFVTTFVAYIRTLIDNHMQGYPTKQHGVAVKRYCRTMNLKADDALIREYIHRHSEGQVWPEILEGIRSVGILEMEIYLLGNRLFMIVETPVDFDWDSAMERLATLPRQQEWEDYMSIFQDCREGDTADEKWMMMDQIFRLYE